MKNNSYVLVILALTMFLEIGFAQDKDIARTKIEELQSKKAGIENAEREALKLKIKRINEQLEKKSITQEAADQQKKTVAELHAANINDRIAILDKSISLIQRNEGLLPKDIAGKERRFGAGFGHEDEGRIIGVFFKRKEPNKLKYDKRLYSDLVFSYGFNSAFREGESLKESPFEDVNTFLELGWAWRYRVLKNSNALRFNFGALFQSNILNIRRGLLDINDSQEVEFFPTETKRGYSKLVKENFVLQFHLETGTSKVRKTESSIRYSLRKQFRLGLGGYFGVTNELEQQLGYDPDDPEIPETDIDPNDRRVFKETTYTFRANDLVYGISGYFGIGGTLLYLKYDLSPTFHKAVIKQNNISLGIRWDM